MSKKPIHLRPSFQILIASLGVLLLLLVWGCRKVNPLYDKDDGTFLRLMDSIAHSKKGYDLDRKDYYEGIISAHWPATFYDHQGNDSSYRAKLVGLDSCLGQHMHLYDPTIRLETTFSEYLFMTEDQARSFAEAQEIEASYGVASVKDEKSKLKSYFFRFQNKVYFFQTSAGSCVDCSRNLIAEIQRFLGCVGTPYYSNENM